MMCSASFNHCDPDLDPALALVYVLARVWRPCLAVFLPGLAIFASAAHAGLALAVPAACDLELPGVSVAELGLTSERLRLPFAVTERAGYYPAGMA